MTNFAAILSEHPKSGIRMLLYDLDGLLVGNRKKIKGEV